MSYTHYDQVSGINGIAVGKKGAEIPVANSTGQLLQNGTAVTLTAAQINATPLNYKKSSLANPSATAATNGTAVVLLPATNYSSMFPEAIDVVFGGTFGAETVTATVKVTYSDNLTATVSKTATAVGTTSFANSDIMSLVKDGVYIKEIDVYSQSTIADSAATVTFNHAGFYLV